jgi:hypothetical protein
MATRDEVKQRLAEVSHATWMLQGILDNGRTFADNFASSDQDRKGTSEWEADVVEATRRLEAVRDEGRSLDEFSEAEAQRVMPHDRERAEESIKALEAMGVVFDSS